MDMNENWYRSSCPVHLHDLLILWLGFINKISAGVHPHQPQLFVLLLVVYGETKDVIFAERCAQWRTLSVIFWWMLSVFTYNEHEHAPSWEYCPFRPFVNCQKTIEKEELCFAVALSWVIPVCLVHLIRVTNSSRKIIFKLVKMLLLLCTWT